MIDVQKIAKAKGFSLAILTRTAQNAQIYTLMSDSQICFDEDYEHWRPPVIGIPVLLVIKDGKASVTWLTDMDKYHLKDMNFVDYSKEYEYGLIQACTETYKKLYPDEFVKNREERIEYFKKYPFLRRR